MRKIKFHLLLFAFMGAIAAYANKAVKFKADYHTYAFSNYNMNDTKIYYLMDLTQSGYQIGIDYDCQLPLTVCTFIGDVSREHSDLTGNWFYVADIPPSGIKTTGTWINLDY